MAKPPKGRGDRHAIGQVTLQGIGIRPRSRTRLDANALKKFLQQGKTMRFRIKENIALQRLARRHQRLVHLVKSEFN